MKTHNATIRVFLTCALLSSISAAHAQDPASAEATAGQAQPNIVLVFMDNFGWGEPGFNGGGITRGATTPRLYNLYTDPQERENVLFPHTWVPKAALGQLGAHMQSLAAEPPIKPGSKDPSSEGESR